VPLRRLFLFFKSTFFIVKNFCAPCGAVYKSFNISIIQRFGYRTARIKASGSSGDENLQFIVPVPIIVCFKINDYLTKQKYGGTKDVKTLILGFLHPEAQNFPFRIQTERRTTNYNV
jgi:hypothetical protein